MSRMLWIGLVWAGCALAWVVLGSTVTARSGGFSDSLTSEVEQLWGPPLAQRPPTASFGAVTHHVEKTTVYNVAGQPMELSVDKEVAAFESIPLASSDIHASLELEHRKKGLLWFPTYGVDFKARYAFENHTGQTRDVTFTFPFDSTSAGLDGFSVKNEDGTAVRWEVISSGATWKSTLKEGQRVAYDVAFHTRGTKSWAYLATNGVGQARNLSVGVDTNFDKVDFPNGSLSPSRHASSGGGWKGEWQFESVISGAPIGIEMPQRLNPGPLAARITFFAPVSLLFFFFVIALLAHRQDKQLHPAHYFFLGTAFFAFHLLFAYLADHLALPATFVVSSVVSVFLVVTYVRLFAGWKFAIREVGISQLIYLVLFSSSFLAEGYTGLAITCGAVATLFVMMQVTGRRLTLNPTTAAALPKLG